MNKIKFISLAAGVSLALAFIFSCGLTGELGDGLSSSARQSEISSSSVLAVNQSSSSLWNEISSSSVPTVNQSSSSLWNEVSSSSSEQEFRTLPDGTKIYKICDATAAGTGNKRGEFYPTNVYTTTGRRSEPYIGPGVYFEVGSENKYVFHYGFNQGDEKFPRCNDPDRASLFHNSPNYGQVTVSNFVCAECENEQ